MNTAFNVVDIDEIPPSKRKEGTPWLFLLASLRDLPPGKAIQIPRNGLKSKGFGARLTHAKKKFGLVVRTRTTPEHFYLWRVE